MTSDAKDPICPTTVASGTLGGRTSLAALVFSSPSSSSGLTTATSSSRGSSLYSERGS